MFGPIQYIEVNGRKNLSHYALRKLFFPKHWIVAVFVQNGIKFYLQRNKTLIIIKSRKGKTRPRFSRGFFTWSILIHTYGQVLISFGIWLSISFRLASFHSYVRLKLAKYEQPVVGCSPVTWLKAKVLSSSARQNNGKLRHPKLPTSL